MTEDQRRAAIRQQIIALSRARRNDATAIADDDVIPQTGYLDSLGIVELVAWFEDFFEIPLSQRDVTIENLGTIARMSAFAVARKAAAASGAGSP